MALHIGLAIVNRNGSYSNASNSWFKTHEGMTSSYTSALRIGLSPAISCFLFAF
ncbi:hypothetical protein COCHEDRAFT_1024453, partial [Bipolaris maydis C5]